MRLFSSRPGTVRRVLVASLVSVSLCAAANDAAAVNIAPEGTGIIGLNSGVNSGLGTPYAHFNAAGNVNDGNPATREDTWNDAGTTTASYVGVLFPGARTDFVQSVSLNMAAFFDGGWFGPNGAGPGASGSLAAEHLIAPTLQVTTDAGATWVDVPNTNNYVSQLTGTVLPVAFGPPTAANTATFTPLAPLTGIQGIRLIGLEGGPASGGFIGVSEFGVEAVVPEPASLGVLGLAGLLALRRRRA